MKRKLLKYTSLILGIAAIVSGKKIYDLGYFSEQKGFCPENKISSITDKLIESQIKLFFEHSTLNLSQRGGYIDDASCLNKTLIAGIAEIKSEKDIINALEFAKANNLKVSVAGSQHSMGGQTFTRGALVLDIKPLKTIEILQENRVKVGAGTTWADLQKHLDQNGYAVKAMQSINIFTVSGTVSVNAHGIAHDPGSINSTIRSIRLILPDGSIKTVTRDQDPELFHHVIGGYGLFGIISEVELDIVPNELYTKKVSYIEYQDLQNFYITKVDKNPDFGLFYARLSITPGKDFLKEIAVHSFIRDPKAQSEVLPLLNEDFHNGNSFLKRAVINFSKTGNFGKWLRWYLEKNHNPVKCLTRNQAMSAPDEVCDVTRNTAMYDSMPYLKNNLKDTDILQEYFVPFRNLTAFIDELRHVIEEEKPNLLNVTIRILPKDEDSVLAYAKEDSFGLVLYFNHDLSPEAQQTLDQVTTRLTQSATNLNGSFYLPYQLTYSKETLQKAYPKINNFLKTKLKYDPTELLQNSWYQKYK